MVGRSAGGTAATEDLHDLEDGGGEQDHEHGREDEQQGRDEDLGGRLLRPFLGGLAAIIAILLLALHANLHHPSKHNIVRGILRVHFASRFGDDLESLYLGCTQRSNYGRW